MFEQILLMLFIVMFRSLSLSIITKSGLIFSRIFFSLVISFLSIKKHLKYLVSESQTHGGLNEQGVKELRKSGFYKSLEKSLNSILKRLNKK